MAFQALKNLLAQYRVNKALREAAPARPAARAAGPVHARRLQAVGAGSPRASEDYYHPNNPHGFYANHGAALYGAHHSAGVSDAGRCEPAPSAAWEPACCPAPASDWSGGSCGDSTSSSSPYSGE
ncbi:hypothetical protein CEK28_08580 [Xenophilus sp. AP218F]|nr:hypothetical protein CEK28_08580 [Xenophilus sp. AP218F]